MRQSLGIHHLFARLFYVFQNVGEHLGFTGLLVDKFEIRPTEAFVEISVLQSHLSLTSAETVIVHLNKFSRHCAVGDMEDPMEMQSVFLRRPLPYTYVTPFFARAEKTQTIREFFAKRTLVVEFVVVGKSIGKTKEQMMPEVMQLLESCTQYKIYLEEYRK